MKGGAKPKRAKYRPSATEACSEPNKLACFKRKPRTRNKKRGQKKKDRQWPDSHGQGGGKSRGSKKKKGTQGQKWTRLVGLWAEKEVARWVGIPCMGEKYRRKKPIAKMCGSGNLIHASTLAFGRNTKRNLSEKDRQWKRLANNAAQRTPARLNRGTLELTRGGKQQPTKKPQRDSL